MEDTATQTGESQDLQTETNTNEGTQEQKTQEVRTLPEEMLDAVHTVVVDGVEKQMTVREIARLQSLEQASQDRFRKAADMNRKLEEFVEHAKKDPEAALRKLGYDPEDFSTQYLKKKIEQMQMSPEQRQAVEERQKFEEEKKLFEDRASQRIREEIDTEMTQAFQKSGLPKSPFFAARMAGLVAQSMERSNNGHGNPLSYEDAAVKVKSWFQNATRETLSSMDPKGILDFLGPDMAKKLQAAFVQRIEGGTVPSANSQGPSSKTEVTQKPKPQKVFKHWKDYHAFVDSL